MGVADKIRKYRTDYNNSPPNSISFMTTMIQVIAVLSLVRLGGYIVNLCDLLFLQTHRGTDRFFSSSGVQLPQSISDQFHYRRAAFSSQLKSKIGNILVKETTLRITSNIDGSPLVSRLHTHPSHSQTSRLLTSPLSLGVPVPRTIQCM
jgi:hypothetical protein